MPLKIGRPADPGPGFVMFGTGLLMFCLSLIGLLKRVGEDAEMEAWAGPHWTKVVAVLLSLFVYVLIVAKLGYLVSTLLLMVFIFRIAEQQKWRVILLKAVLSAGVTYLVFDRWLECQLPKGILGF
jgi:hypothetical protein